jgi:hypothetical protein
MGSLSTTNLQRKNRFQNQPELFFCKVLREGTKQTKGSEGTKGIED